MTTNTIIATSNTLSDGYTLVNVSNVWKPARAERIAHFYKTTDADGSQTWDETVILRVNEATTITAIYFCPDAAMTSNDSDYAQLTIQKRNGSGGGASTVASIATKTLLGGGTGDWTAFVPVSFGSISNGSLAIGNILTFEITKPGDGIIPAGNLIVYYMSA